METEKELLLKEIRSAINKRKIVLDAYVEQTLYLNAAETKSIIRGMEIVYDLVRTF